MSKAFDKVSHNRSLLRLRDFGFSGNIFKWFQSYLQDRRQRTNDHPWSNIISYSSNFRLKVTQGSILGPLLFLLYEDDLLSSIVSSSIATYADDTKLFKEINCLDDATALQDDLSNFETSSTNAGLSGLQLNTAKCKAPRVTRRRQAIEHPYTVWKTKPSQNMNVIWVYGSPTT
ncbi:Hypothetical predicted protein [Paramuricea clavata]|uniref:Uncharacterized protein n=1 Tax=Paramuricea clavata TaxID=317549 RepID=A0A6S7IR96_PARCT|nr:Hypothetical predicted protein [Paramuricea clavata]